MLRAERAEAIDPAITTYGIVTEKSEPIVEVKPVPSDGGGSTMESNDTLSNSPEQPAPEEEPARGVSTEEESDNPSNKILDPKLESKPGSGVQASKALLTITEQYEKLAKKLKNIEKRLKVEFDWRFKDGEEEIDDLEEEKEEEIMEVEDMEVEDMEGEKEEEKVEGPFSLRDQVRYIQSDVWCTKNSRSLWSSSSSSHTLVVSMKSSGINTVHPLPDIDTKPSEALKDRNNIGDDMANRDPDRVAIVCQTVLAEISRISGANLKSSANVLVQPFKVLVPFYDQFTECLEEKQSVCDKLLAEKAVIEKAKPELTTEAPKEDKNENKKEGMREDKSEDKMEDKEQDKKKDKDTEEEWWSTEKRSQLNNAQKIVNGMKCILHFLDTDLHDSMEVRRQIKDKTLKEIAFEHLWYLFKPGDLVVSRKPKDQAYRVLHIGGGRHFRDGTDRDGKPVFNNGQRIPSDFFLDCYSISFNGTHYGTVPKYITISPYDGLRQVATLDLVPISLLPEKERTELEDMLITRGKKFVKLARVSHVKYGGLSLKEGNFRHEEVDGDAIIDFALAFRNSKAPYEIEPPSFGGDIIEEPTKADIKETKEVVQGCSTFGHCEILYVYDDSEFDLARRTTFINLPSTSLGTVLADEGKLGRDRHMLLPYCVYGYVLLSRRWYPLDIDLVQDVKETQKDTPDGFSDLVLPEDHKQIVRALVKTHARGPRSTSSKKDGWLPPQEIDLVKGKGKGLIILLHGVPGVGKTSTAECVAANTNRPLFPITCGDIGGTTAKEVEDNLESYFDLARKWGCVLLLDEADVFLGERMKGDFVQNSLVSVFLRVLEYYSGILILTTNRVGQFDEAIKSRVHISLYFPPLTRKSSLEIWKMNLNRLEREDKGRSTNRPITFSRKEIMKFAQGHWADNEASKTNWNGRQIKNAFQTAIALAEWDYMDSQTKLKSDNGGLLLEARHFRQVAEASARFDQYLASVRNTDATNAKAKNNRKDDFVDTGIPTETGLRYPNLKETKTADRAKQRFTPQLESDDDSLDTDTSNSSGEEFKMKKQEMDRLRAKKEEQQRKKEEAERNAKRKQKELRKQQQREKEEAKREEQLSMQKKSINDDDSE